MFNGIEIRPHRKEFFSRARDVGANSTEATLNNTWFNAPEFGHTGFVPWERANGSPAAEGTGPFNLERMSEAFWDNFLQGIEDAAADGLVTQVKMQPDYYACGSHTVGALWVPDRDQHPRRFNIQGEKLGDPNNDDGIHFFVATDRDKYGNLLLDEACRRLKSYVEKGWVYFCPALEMAESRLHTDTMARIKRHFPNVVFVCNRQESPSGMNKNMTGKGFQGVEEHAHGNLQRFLTQQSPGNIPPTRKEMLEQCKPLSLYLSSDGCRIDKDPNSVYSFSELEEIATFVLRFGGNWFMQSMLKMTQFAWGRVDFGPMDLKELPMMRRIYKRWKG